MQQHGRSLQALVFLYQRKAGFLAAWDWGHGCLIRRHQDGTWGEAHKAAVSVADSCAEAAAAQLGAILCSACCCCPALRPHCGSSCGEHCATPL